MAESISKLAVIITGNAAPLSREMEAAKLKVRGFQREVDSGTGSLLKMGQALSASRGNLAAIWNLPAAGPAAGMVAAAAGAARLAVNAARAADVIQTDLVKAVDEFNKKRMEMFPSGGGPQLSFTPDRTWTQAQEELNDEFGKSGTILSGIFRDLTDGASMLVKAAREYRQALGIFNSGFLLLSAPEDATRINKQREELQIQAALLENLKTRTKLAEEAAKKDEQDREKARKHIEDMAKDVRSFMDTLRTPFEETVDKALKLREILESGAISPERFSESLDRIINKFIEDQKTTPKNIRRAGTVGAAERFTSAGQAAVESGREELKRIQQVEKQQLEEHKKAAGQREKILDAINKKPPVNLIQGNL